MVERIARKMIRRIVSPFTAPILPAHRYAGRQSNDQAI